MKTSEIKKGIAYAYKRSSHSGAELAMVLVNPAPEFLFARTSRWNTGVLFVRAPYATKPQTNQSTYSNTEIGYPMVMAHVSEDKAEQVIALLAKVTLKDFVKAESRNVMLKDEATDEEFEAELLLLTDVKRIAGNWHDVITAEREEERQAREQRQAIQEENQRECKRVDDLVSELKRLGFKATRHAGSWGYIVGMDASEMERLLEIVDYA